MLVLKAGIFALARYDNMNCLRLPRYEWDVRCDFIILQETLKR